MARCSHLVSACAGALVAGGLMFAIGLAPAPQGDGGLKPKADAPKIPAPQDPGQPGVVPIPPELAAAMEFMQPGPEHAWLARKVGAWTAAGKMWSDPDAAPMEFNGTNTYRMILGGRYLVEELKSEMMGQPFEAMGITAFDRQAKKFQIAWLDTMGTAITEGSGTRSADGKVLTITMRMFDPMAGKEITMRGVETTTSDDSFTYEMFGPAPAGGEMKVMQLVYTRVKGA